MVYSLVHLNSFFYLKVLPNQALKHRVNFAKRSRTKGNTTNGNNNDKVQVHVEKIERHSAVTNRIGTTHSIKQAGQWLTSRPLIALGGVNIINSVCKIQVVSDPH